MAAAKKTGRVKSTKARANPPPIEGEILADAARKGAAKSVSPAGAQKSVPSGAGMIRRFAWYLAAAGVVFVAGLVAAPTIQGGLDRLFGGDEVAPSSPSPAALPAARKNDTTAPFVEPAPAPAAAIMPADGEIGEDVAPEGGLADSAEDYRLISARLDALEARLREIEARPQPQPAPSAGPDDPRIAGLDARLARLELAAPGAGASAGDKMLLALARLSQRVVAGDAYGGEMLEIRALYGALPDAARSGNEAHMRVLEVAADSGVKNIAALRRAFADSLPAALAAAALPEDAGWWDKVWAQLRGVVVVRRVGQVEGGDAEAVLARVEFSLAGGDIAAALGEAQNLDARVREALAPWQAAAARSLAAQRAVTALVEAQEAFTATRSPAGDG